MRAPQKGSSFIPKDIYSAVLAFHTDRHWQKEILISQLADTYQVTFSNSVLPWHAGPSLVSRRLYLSGSLSNHLGGRTKSITPAGSPKNSVWKHNCTVGWRYVNMTICQLYYPHSSHEARSVKSRHLSQLNLHFAKPEWNGVEGRGAIFLSCQRR